MSVWTETQARERLDDLLDEAARQGPQVIHRANGRNVVILDIKAFEGLTRSEGRFKDLLASLPEAGPST